MNILSTLWVSCLSEVGAFSGVDLQANCKTSQCGLSVRFVVMCVM